MKYLFRAAGLMLLMISVPGCGGGGTSLVESEFPRSAQERIDFSNNSLFLWSELWRNFMPGDESTGDRRLFAVLSVRAHSGGTVATDLTPVKVWLKHGSEVWSTDRIERVASSGSDLPQFVARNGPL